MRLDEYLVNKKLLPSREKAKEWIKEGKVIVNSEKALKASKKILEKDEVKITEELKYVSRAGYKLEKAIKEFGIDCFDKICLDIGSSTGGFTDCLLQYGAKRVYALEISTGELAEKLVDDSRIINMEGTNILSDWVISDKAKIISCDCTFLSLKDVLPKLNHKISKNAIFIGLIKPPFEIKALKEKTDLDHEYQILIEALFDYAKKLDWGKIGFCESPILGKNAGQVEFLMVIYKK
jgi:23S rRNA (cytidine1920-2'-O)/16S rRNA (cytidine1409-2'-O)-methyltransferase